VCEEQGGKGHLEGEDGEGSVGGTEGGEGFWEREHKEEHCVRNRGEALAGRGLGEGVCEERGGEEHLMSAEDREWEYVRNRLRKGKVGGGNLVGGVWGGEIC
jgi:hypothetical protein